MNTKITKSLFVIAMVLAAVFALSLLSVQAKVDPERAEDLTQRLELLGVVSDNLQIRKESLIEIIEDIERQQTELTREADSHRRELAGTQVGL